MWTASVLLLLLLAGCALTDRLPDLPPMPKMPKMPKFGKSGAELPAHVGPAGSGSYLFYVHCSQCHSDPPAEGFVEIMRGVPTITDPRRVSSLDQGWLYRIISEGGSAVGKRSSMPPYEDVLTEADIRRIISYLNGNPI